MFWNIDTKISFAMTLQDESSFSLAGRVLSFRKMGGVSFGHISDSSGKMQFCIKRSDFENYTDVVHQIKMGVHIGISGVIWTSSTGEKTLLAKSFKLLQTPQRGFPDKWNGISDEEVRLRKRYLDTSFDMESRNVFLKRSQIISSIRNFLNERDFVEFQTPIMSAAASGAMAKPFVTHHNSLDADLFLRIAPETFLKRIVGGGFDRVYEIGQQFRNEGFSRAHLQEFTTIEWYAAYFDYMDNLNMFEDLLKKILNDVCGSTTIRYGDVVLDFGNIEVASYASLFKKHLNIGITNYSGDLDLLFKKEIRPNLIQPIFVKDYPSNMVPLSDVNSDGNAEMWQLIVNGWELVKCYTELVDPAKQRINFEQQANEKNNGNEEAMVAEEEFLEAMEYGMPPMSGLGLGIDRLVCILTNQQSLRDVVYFPLMLERN